MIRSRDDERAAFLESLARQGFRRRLGQTVESQPPRCPICQKEMRLLLGVHGPQWRCGCGERCTK